jgi:recombination protein RecA
MIGGTLSSDGKTPKCPGYPRGRVTEIYGPEASGKTTLALHAIAEVQKAGGLAMFLDFEHALDHDYARAVGVDYHPDKFLYYKPETLEMGFKMMYAGICLGVDMVVLDSVAALVSEKELKKDMAKEGRIGERARQMANFLPKLVMWLASEKYSKNKRGGTACLFINQTRALIGGSGKGGPGESTPGGKALKFFAYLRIRTWRTGSETIEKKDKFTGQVQTFAYGNRTRVKIVKSKLDAKEGFTTDIFIRFGQGIDDHYSIIEAGASNKVINKGGGGWYQYGEHKMQGRDKFREFLVGNPKVYEEVKAKVLAAVRSGDDGPAPKPDGVDAILVSMDAEFGPTEGGDEEDFDAEDFGFEGDGEPGEDIELGE